MAKEQFSFVSLGCARTLVDSETMINDLKGKGFQLVNENSSEESVVLNTCAFIQSAVDETEENIRQLSERKKKQQIKHLAVVGCYPSRYKKSELESRFPEVDLWLTTKEGSRLKEEMTKLVFKKKYHPVKPSPFTKLTPNHYSYIKISEGCNNWCAFCTIPKIRGAHVSRTIEEIRHESEKQIALGAKELLLVAEDTTAWGEDLFGEPSLHLLLEALVDLPVNWIRPMYIFPSRVTDALIDVFRKYPEKYGYIDIPVQHANTEILTGMKRHHDKTFLLDVLKKMKLANPDISLRTTLLLGFPGETDAHVDELEAFLEEIKFSQIGCFGYSPEKGTRAYKFKETVSAPDIRSRIHRIMAKQYQLMTQVNEARLGKTYPFVYEGQGFGRTQHEAPEVDGMVKVENAENLEVGVFYNIKMTGIQGYDLIGEVVSA
ncbi:MAG: ribosomal protein S12 methylthiotransferase [Candidatus Marinamargulisbacteria bacterium]|jgi:ribosomal protein S12 methylthiotransferase